VTVKKFWKSVSISRSYRPKYSGTFFSGHGVYIHIYIYIYYPWIQTKALDVETPTTCLLFSFTL